MDDAKDIAAAVDQLAAALRAERDFRLAETLHHYVHRTAWNNRSELYSELSRLLRNAQASQVSSYSTATSAKVDELLSAIERCSDLRGT